MVAALPEGEYQGIFKGAYPTMKLAQVWQRLIGIPFSVNPGNDEGYDYVGELALTNRDRIREIATDILQERGVVPC